MTTYSFGQQAKTVVVLPPAADAAGRTSEFVDCRYAGRINVLAIINQGNAAPVTLTLLQSAVEAGTGPVALTDPCLISLDDSEAASDGMIDLAPGVSYVTDATLATKAVLFEINPATLGLNNLTAGTPYLGITTSASNAANVTCVLVIMTDLRYSQDAANQPSSLV